MTVKLLKLTQIQAVYSNNGTILFGLDVEGQVWHKRPQEVWLPVGMETEQHLCPECGQLKNDPRCYRLADGHGGLASYCTSQFHKD